MYKTESKDESYPWITPDEMPKWEILLMAHINAKKAQDGLTKTRPTVDEEKLARLRPNGRDTELSKAYQKEIRTKIKLWEHKDALAYSIIVKACTYSPSAMTVVLDNAGVSAAQLHAKLKERFDQKDMVGVIQAKLASFNSMVLAESETPESFVNRLIVARIGLNNLGCDYIDKDVHCLGRLKEALMQDSRYKDVAINLSIAPDMSWERALKVVNAFETSHAARLLNSPEPTAAKPKDQGDSDAMVRRLKAKFGRKIKSLQKRINRNDSKKGKTCNYCNKPGHFAAECRKKQRDNRGQETETRTCYNCGKPGHLAKDCKKRKASEDSGGYNRGKSARHVDDTFSDGEYSRMMSEYTRKHDGKITLDSGATSHMLTQSAVARLRNTDLKKAQQAVSTAKAGESIMATSRGRVGNLSDVLVMEDGVLTEGIASVAKLDMEGKHVMFGGGKAKIYDKNMNLLVEAPLGTDRTYRFKLSDLTGEERVRLGNATPPDTLDLYHKRLGHRNKRDLGRAIKEGLVIGVPLTAAVNRKTGLCDACVKAKSTRHSFSHAKSEKCVKQVNTIAPKCQTIRRVVTDLKGPIGVSGLQKENYLQLFTEEDTKFRACKLMVTKAEALTNLKEYIEIDLASEGQRLLEYHSDAAPELISRDTVIYLAAKGCRVSYSPPYTPERNGVAERSNRTIWESAYAMWLASVLPATFWTHAVMYATVIANVLPTETAYGWMSPFQAKYGTPADIHVYRMFGCIAYVHINEQLRDSTFAEKAYRGYFVGLKWPLLDRYLVFVSQLDKVCESAHVQFDEVTKLHRKEEELLVVTPERKTVKDFAFLTHMAYRDDESGIMFVTTRVSTSRGFIVAYRAPVVEGRLGPEEPQPIHAKDVENMLTTQINSNDLLMWVDGRLTNACNVLQGAPELAMAQRSDQSHGALEPAALPAPPLPGGNPGTGSVERRVTPVSEHRMKPPVEHDTVGRGPTGRAEAAATLYGRPQRRRVQRQLTNVGTLGDTSAPTERAAYLAVYDMMEADESNDKGAEWVPAKVEEMRSLVLEHDAWDVTFLPPGRRTVSTKWVVKRKEKPNPKLKARFTPRGFTQQAGVDYGETFAPVAKLVTLRIFLTIVAILSLATIQLDLKTAFLNATLEEEIYCQPVYDHLHILKELAATVKEAWQRTKITKQLDALKKGAVLRMKKACYGLKQAPREWWKKLHKFLLEQGFRANKSDICFYVLHVTGGVVLLLLYVDDLLFAASTGELLHRYAGLVSKAFLVSSEGPLSSYLGFDLEIDLRRHRVFLLMQRFMEKVFNRFKLVAKQSVKTPLPENFQAALEDAVPADERFVEDFQYREKIGCILYYMICMRPDIAFAVGLLARYSNKVSRVACAGVTQLLQYCYNTRSLRLVLGGIRATITAYCDSDWAGDRETRKSTGAYIVFLGTGPVEWASKLQRLPAQSSAEAEFIALNDPAKSIVWMRWLLKQTGISALVTEFSSTLFGDNTASLAMASNPVHHNRTKHIAIKYYLIRELTKAGVVSTEHVDTLLNVADIGTKALGRVKFEPLRDIALGVGDLERPAKRQRTEVSDEFV